MLWPDTESMATMTVKSTYALDALQRLLSLKTQTAARRERQVRAERRATSIRRESR